MNIRDLSFQTRVEIIKFFRLTYERSSDFTLNFYYNSKTKKFSFRDVSSGDGPVKVDIRRIFRKLYGYFVEDRTRKIHFIPGRVCISFISSERYAVKVKLKDYVPFGTNYLMIDMQDDVRSPEDQQEVVPNDIQFDFSGVHFSWIHVKNVEFSNQFIKSFSSMKLIRLKSPVDLFSMDTTWKAGDNLSVENFKRISSQSTIIRMAISGFREEDEPSQVFSPSFESRCKTAFLKGPRGYSESIRMPDSVYTSLNNCLKMTIQEFNFSMSLDLIEFFRNLRKYVPKLRYLCLRGNKILSAKHVKLEEDPLEILLSQNKSLEVLETDLFECFLGPFGSKSFRNDTLKKMLFVLRGENMGMYIPFLKKVTLVLKNMHSIDLVSYSLAEISELSNFLYWLEETAKKRRRISHLGLCFPEANCSDEIYKALKSLSLKSLSFTTLDLVGNLGKIFEMESLEKLVLNTLIMCDQITTVMLDSVLEVKNYKITKDVLRLLEKNMKSLRIFEFNRVCAPFIYFLEHSKHLQQIEFASNCARVIDGDITLRIGDESFYEFERKASYFTKCLQASQPTSLNRLFNRKMEIVKSCFREKVIKTIEMERLGPQSQKVYSVDAYDRAYDERKKIEKIADALILRNSNEKRKETEEEVLYREKSVERWSLLPPIIADPNLVCWKQYYETRDKLENNKKKGEGLVDQLHKNFNQIVDTIFPSPEDENRRKSMHRSYYVEKTKRGYCDVDLRFRFYSIVGDGQSYELSYYRRHGEKMLSNEYHERIGANLIVTLFSRNLLANSNFFDYDIPSQSKLEFWGYCLFNVILKKNRIFDEDNMMIKIETEDLISLFYRMMSGGVEIKYKEENETIDLKWMIRETRRKYKIGKEMNGNEEGMDFVDCIIDDKLGIDGHQDNDNMFF